MWTALIFGGFILALIVWVLGGRSRVGGVKHGQHAADVDYMHFGDTEGQRVDSSDSTNDAGSWDAGDAGGDGGGDVGGGGE
jgi:hypothetical protein